MESERREAGALASVNPRNLYRGRWTLWIGIVYRRLGEPENLISSGGAIFLMGEYVMHWLPIRERLRPEFERGDRFGQERNRALAVCPGRTSSADSRNPRCSTAIAATFRTVLRF